MNGKTYIPLIVLFLKTVVLNRLGIVIEDPDLNAFVNVTLLGLTAIFRYMTGRKLEKAQKRQS